jgi:hypothetical protein
MNEDMFDYDHIRSRFLFIFPGYLILLVGEWGGGGQRCIVYVCVYLISILVNSCRTNAPHSFTCPNHH